MYKSRTFHVTLALQFKSHNKSKSVDPDKDVNDSHSGVEAGSQS